MPQKDKEQTEREKKKSKKDGSKDRIYSSKHIRMMEKIKNKKSNKLN